MFSLIISFLALMVKHGNSKALTVGQKLQNLRRIHGFNGYKTFSAELAIEPKHYWMLENDKVDFRISSLKRILKYYDISAHEFFKNVAL